MRNSVALLILVSLSLSGTAAGWSDNHGFSVTNSGGGIRVSRDGAPILVYQLDPKAKQGEFARANYIHPLYDLHGRVLTEDFPADHLHHRGVFWSWHQLLLNGKSLADPWACKDISWSAPKIGGDGSTTLNLEVARDWLVPNPERPSEQLPVVKMTVSVEVPRPTDSRRIIDVELKMRALVEGISIGGSADVKGYGGFSPRIKLSEDVKFTGQTGPVKPHKTAVEGGAWMNVSQTLDGKSVGFAMLVHPSHPQFPLKWILRSKRSMQNPQWPGNQPVAISTTEDTVLRYRMVVHDGTLTPGAIDKIWKSFAKKKLETP
ncbi:MAG: hypothetical protein ACI9OD_003725 [Limisphaerales bacterium]|jgi:hypothetical protein